MRRTDRQPRGDNPLASPAPSDGLPGNRHQADPRPAEAPASDGTKGPVSNWEAAWIDLGGEG
jgi:hypothetical protein